MLRLVLVPTFLLAFLGHKAKFCSVSRQIMYYASVASQIISVDQVAAVAVRTDHHGSVKLIEVKQEHSIHLPGCRCEAGVNSVRLGDCAAVPSRPAAPPHAASQHEGRAAHAARDDMNKRAERARRWEQVVVHVYNQVETRGRGGKVPARAADGAVERHHIDVDDLAYVACRPVLP
eukprot:345133-Pleurochrysis_carterae.AAC.6